ncbi:MAG: 3'-5' exoribonuclease YhaM family protein [Solirubrobacteraceae bacterium]
MLVRELQDGSDIDQVLLVKEVEARQKRDGGEFLKLVLADRSGTVPAMVWDGVAQFRELCVAGSPVRVIGRYAVSSRYGAQVTVRAVRQAAPGSFDLAELLDGPPRSPEQMELDLRELVATVRNPHLQSLLERFFGAASSTWASYRSAPAAKFFHQAYRHGLLEHSLSVAQAVGAISATFPGIDRDVAVTGALLHDIGKLEAYTADPTTSIDLTDDGRLQGEIPLGYFRVRREIEELDDFPPALARAVLHIILSHHGSLAHGSPVVPCTREATLVHMIDNLGGRLGSFDRLEKELPRGQEWSGFDRAIGSGAWFGLQLASALAEEPADEQQVRAA